MATPQSPSLEELAKQQQVAMMHNAQMQFISLITCSPAPPSMPLDVRRHMWNALTKTRQLFAPQTPEEEAFYDAER